MDRIKTRLIIAVTNRLSAAEDTNAKADLIEELSENLYQRYLDLIGSGVSEEDAYRQALDDLGDVDELLEYLRSLGPDGELPRQEDTGRDYFGDLIKAAEDVVRETISQTKDAVGQAKVIVRDVTEKLREKYPNGFEGNVHVRFVKDDDDHGEHPRGRPTRPRKPRRAARTGRPGTGALPWATARTGAASSLRRARAGRWRAPSSPPIR